MLTPRLDILPVAQLRLWSELQQIPDPFVLYGGTALALRLGHRQSVDFDFFAFRSIDQSELRRTIPLLDDAEVMQQEPNTLSVLIERGSTVRLSFFGLPRLFALRPADAAADNGLHIASLLDLAATKVSVIQMRAEAKDYLDLHALLTRTDIDLPLALAAGRTLYGRSFNPQITLKALSYFDDGDVTLIPDATKQYLVTAARSVDLDRLPEVVVP